jgi:ABC-2 type transport system ATP-binding protein
MDHGSILAIDAPAALVRAMDTATRISLALDALPEATARALPGVLDVTSDELSLVLTTRQPSAVLTELARREALEGLAVKGGTLEDVFLELTGREYRA